MKNRNILSSLTKAEIEDPFQIRAQSRKNEQSRNLNSNFMYVRRSPGTISSSDQNGIVVINRQ